MSKSTKMKVGGLLPMGKVAIKSLVLGALLIVLLECYYVITTPGTTIYAASVDVLLSFAVMFVVAFLFITELKGVKTEAEAGAKELASSEEKYRRLLGDINDGYFVIQDEKYVIVNQRAADVLGVPIDQIVGIRLGDQLPGSPLNQGPASPASPSTLERYRKRIKGELPPVERYEVSAGAGRTFEYSVKIIDYEGRPAVSAVVREITERKRAEEALRESERRYRHLFENLNDAAFLADMETGVILETNLQGEALLGRSRDEIVGMHQSELHPPDKSDEYRRRFAAHVEKGRLADFDGEIIRKDGTVVPVAIMASPLTLGGQRVILGLFHDITERKRAQAQLEARAKELAASEEKFRRLLGDINDGYCVIQDEKYVIANQTYADALGVSIDQIVGTSLGQDSASESPALRFVLEKYNKRIKGELPPAERYELITAAGRTYEYSVKLIDYQGRPAVSAVVRDITRRKRIEEALRESERLYSTMAHASEIGVYIVQDGKFVLVNRQFQKDTGYAEDELLGKDSLSLVHPEDREMVRENAVKMLKGERLSSYEYRFISKRGETRWIMETVASIQYQGKRAALGNFMDISERKQMEETIKHMAYHDPLTGLPNRMLFDDRLSMELAHARRNQEELAVLFLDLDRFKEVNDTLGHKMGDLLLRAVGERLTSLLRKSDTVARMGGDEFALILPEMAQAEDADKVAQKILESLREPFGLDGTEVRTTASIGIAVYPDHEKDADTLLSNADTAMYCAKEQGGDRYLRYTPAMGTGSLGETTTIAPELLPVSGDTQDEG